MTAPGARRSNPVWTAITVGRGGSARGPFFLEWRDAAGDGDEIGRGALTLADALREGRALARQRGIPFIDPSWLADMAALPESKRKGRAGAWVKDYRGNPVPASRYAGQSRAAKDKVGQAADLYRRFTGNEPWQNAQVVHEPDRDTFLRVGTVDGILYTTNRDGKREKYIHNFRPQSRPALLVSEDGKVARTHGGDFTFTERGFVDEEKGRAVE